jgi:hypothetical protein
VIIGEKPDPAGLRRYRPRLSPPIVSGAALAHVADDPVGKPPLLTRRLRRRGLDGLAAAEDRAAGRQEGSISHGDASLARPPPGTAMGLVPAFEDRARSLPKI